MTPICLLTDYKDRFGSKWQDEPYRSGCDRRLLADSFAQHGYAVEYVPFAEVFRAPRQWRGQVVLYTSSEEIGRNYRDYIEDVVFGLEEAGARVLPRAAFCRAHDNKVFMEMLRDCLLGEELTGLKSRCFGTREEVAAALQRQEIPLPCVLKSSTGAMSRGVFLAQTAAEVLEKATQLGRSPHRLYELRDFVRARKYAGYLPESRYQRKLVVQPLIPGLTADWKVLVYGDQYYVLKRHVRPGDFRASGSHTNYLAGRLAEIPAAALDLVENVYNRLDIPHLSADVAFDGKRPYLFEFQAVYFGPATQVWCEEYFTRQDGKWVLQPKTHKQEEAYVWAVAHYLRCHPHQDGGLCQ